MKSKDSIRPIWRVEYRDDEGNLQFASVFFNYKEDAQDYAEAFSHIGCSHMICKYWLQ